MSAQHAEATHPVPPPPKTVADIRAALRQGRGFPGDAESFEADLARALDASTPADLHRGSQVLNECAGSIAAFSDPEFDAAVEEGLDLIAEIKKRRPLP
ncbi:hypothetical protein [Streptomyces sp. NPDC051909]|uniref:hypothetical protein n=1 Tax=Streptomyces sp. NPDC051909 TaxID=3154944 RepID=UPI003422628D